jgi:epoxyqueuosine reductase QueG
MRPPPSHCPYCNELLSNATPLVEAASEVPNPMAVRGVSKEYRTQIESVPGTFSVCIYCNEICPFDSDLKLRKLTDEDKMILRDHPEIKNGLELYPYRR